MMTMAILVGIWTTTCIQTQISNVNQGFVKETYAIQKDGVFEFKREWFTDSACAEPNGTDVESGTIELGNRLTGFFVSGETYEATFNTQAGVDLGAISITKNQTLRVARGVRNSTMRNTMLGLFEYTLQN